MKVIYEFNCEIGSDDDKRIKVFQISNDMLEALREIQEYLRLVRKGNLRPTANQIEEKISVIIYDSGIGE